MNEDIPLQTHTCLLQNTIRSKSRVSLFGFIKELVVLAELSGSPEICPFKNLEKQLVV